MLEAFHDRLRDLCAHDGEGSGCSRARLIECQTQQARALAGELGVLKSLDCTRADWRAHDPDLKYGTEHIVDFAPGAGRVAKTTIPGKFGLVLQLLTHPAVNLRDDPSLPATRLALEFVPASPLEYLQRWRDANALFGDDVRLAAVVEWADGQLSFSITQPQYDGEPAPLRDIIAFFAASG